MLLNTDFVKVRMQTSNKSDHRGEYRSFAHAVTSIVAAEGFLVLYTGIVPTIIRASVLSAVELSCYETASSLLILHLNLPPQSLYVAAIAALIAGFFSSIATCPLDMARSRLMALSSKPVKPVKYTSKTARSSDSSHIKNTHRRHRKKEKTHANPPDTSSQLDSDSCERFSGVLDCLSQTWRKEGFFAMWTGQTMFLIVHFYIHKLLIVDDFLLLYHRTDSILFATGT